MLSFLLLATQLGGAALQTSAPPPTSSADASAKTGWSTFWWGDYDADGLADAWVVGAGGLGRLLHNAGGGELVDATASAGLDGLGAAHMALWADYDRDGRLDLFLASWNGASKLLRQTAPGGFQEVTQEAGLGATSLVADAEWRDYDADGALDLRLTTWGEEVLFHNAGAGRFERVALDLPSGIALGAGGAPPATPDEARGQLALAPVQPGSGAAAATRSAAGASGSGGSSALVAQPSAICVSSMEDASNPAVCLQASSIPTLGMLHPLSTEFFIDASSGDVGIGTTAPNARLDVVGGDVRTSGRFESLATSGSPLIVNSTTVVANLNADKLDGFEAASFSQFGPSVDTSEIAPNAVNSSRVLDGSLTAADLADSSVGTGELALGAVNALDIAANAIFNVHVAAAAAIAGTKVVPDFGAQNVLSTGTASFGSDVNNTDFAVRGESSNGPTRGYLGVQGAPNFGGQPTADWDGLEIGVAGISTGSTVNDNYGVLGHGSFVGVRGENSVDPASYAELGRGGTGLFATGPAFAAELEGVVTVDVSSGSPGFDVLQTGTGRAGSFVQGNPSGLAALFASSLSTNTGHRTLYATHSGGGVGGVALLECTNEANTAINTWIKHAGTGEALLVGSENTIRTVQLTRSTNHLAGNDMLQIDVPSGSGADSQFIECERGTDIEFRVDGDGDVFADGAFTGPADFAEMIAVTRGAVSVEAGDVLVIDPSARRSVGASMHARSTLVAGVYSTAPGFVGSERSFVEDGPDGEKRSLKRADMAELHDEVPMAVVGIVPCKVSLENGPIFPGDLLVTSSTRGHAMRDPSPPVGTVVGKALEAYDGKGGPLGTIKILVTLQ